MSQHSDSATAFFASFIAMIILTGVAADSRAAQHSSLTLAVDNCNGALPGYEGAFRKRPLGILNEGSSNAFISCSVAVDGVANRGTSAGILYLTNRASTAEAVTCTMIDGFSAELSRYAFPSPVYYTKTVGLAAGEAVGVAWTASEFGVAAFSDAISFSCNLPPRVEINIAASLWDDVAPAP